MGIINKKYPIVVGWCDSGIVDGKFTEGLMSTTILSAQTDTPIVSSLRVHGNQIARQRQNLMDYWIDNVDVDWLLWVDSDIVITPKILEMLSNVLKNDNIEIVSGVYFISKQTESSLMQPMPCIFTDIDEYQIKHIHPMPDNQIIEIDSSGMGIVLMKKSLALKLRKNFPNQSVFAEKEGLGDKFIGEDISFFRKVKDSGIKIYAHTGAIVKHMKRFSFDENYYKMYWDNEDKITQ